MSSWVDRMRMEPLTSGPPSGTAATPKRVLSSAKDNNPDDDRPLEFNIASLNLLAESYLTPRSHPGLPSRYADVAFDPSRRRKLLLETLERFCGPRTPAAAESHDDDDDDATRKWDVLALQELDLVEDGDPILPAFESWGYRVVRTPSDQRRDCCAIVYDAGKFTLKHSEVVRFDDLATLKHARAEDGSEGPRNHEDDGGSGDICLLKANGTPVTYHNIKPGRSNSPPELTGMVRSFLRRNCAVVVRLESVLTGQSVVVASVHLYWHPGYEYVKLCQAKYLLDFVAAFAIMEQRRAAADATTTTPTKTTTTTQQVPSVIICGDINSKPGSAVHKLFVEPHVDARTVAPWRYFWDQDNEEMYTEEDDNGSTAKEEEGVGRRDEVTTEYYSDIDSGNESSEIAASQQYHDHVLVGDDPTDTINSSDFPTVISDPKKERASGQNVMIESTGISFPAGGYMMSELTTNFTAFCGIICEAPAPNTLKVEPTEANVDTSYDDFKSNQYESQLLDTTKIEILETSIPDIDPAESNDHINGADDHSKASLAMRRVLKHHTPQDYHHSTPPLPVKYMLDYTLNRFTRWLRLLGIDARLERLEEETERTSGGKIALFDHCNNERRTLITTSYKLLLRKDCPPGAYLLDPKSTSYLEEMLPRLLRTHGVELTPSTFLTRCVLCNGGIYRVSTEEEKRAVFTQHDAPGLLDCNLDEVEVFRCTRCSQGYWWDERPASSASRSFNQATKLLRLCLRGGVALKDETATEKNNRLRQDLMGAFEFVDISKEREAQDRLTSENHELAVIEWLNEEKLSSPFKLKSAMALGGTATARESLPFTNVTKEFVGTLDYIFFSEQRFEQLCKLTLPTSFKEMNPTGIRQGHLIPSDIWPSDHIAVGARLRLKRKDTPAVDRLHISPHTGASNDAVSDKSTTNNSTEPHGRTCGCGCVPQILSLFEMAALRKKAREKKMVGTGSR